MCPARGEYCLFLPARSMKFLAALLLLAALMHSTNAFSLDGPNDSWEMENFSEEDNYSSLSQEVTSPLLEAENNNSEANSTSEEVIFALLEEDNNTLEASSEPVPNNPTVSLFNRDIQNRIELSKTTLKNITCKDINNITFTNAPPFAHLDLPECGDYVQPEIVLYMPTKNGTKQCKIDPKNIPNKNTTSCFELIKQDPKIWKVVVVTHGFTKTFRTRWLHWAQEEIFQTDPNVAVIIVGWGGGLFDLRNFYQAAANTRYLGQLMFQMLSSMHSTVGRAIHTHCIGHSLGAHGCAFMGKHLIAKDPKLKLNRISGLDPAGPLFTNDVPFPFDNLKILPTARLGPNDAAWVDNIHTDGEDRAFGVIPQYGTMEPLGTVDFYPGTGGSYGHDQPGCYDVFNIVSCSHSRAWKMYVESINSTICLPSKQCKGDPKLIPKNCVTTTGKHALLCMGYWWDTKHPMPGMYTVEVTSGPDYCKKTKTLEEVLLGRTRHQEVTPVVERARGIKQNSRSRQPKLPKWANDMRLAEQSTNQIKADQDEEEEFIIVVS